MESVEVETVAIPLLFRTDVPSETVPSINVTEPVGVPLVVELTVALIVTGCATPTGLLDDVNTVFVPAACTDCAIVTV